MTKRKVPRSAVDGRFVTRERAEKHPNRTYLDTIDYPDREIPDPPPDPWEPLLEIDCAVVDARLAVYSGWNASDQGPRHPDQLVVLDEGAGSFLRFRSEPVDHPVSVWSARDKRMVTFPAGSYVSAGAQIDAEFGSITYGAVEVEARATQASDGTRIAVLLWPDGPPAWPSREVDYPEVSGDGDDRERQAVGLNSHYKDASGKHQQHSLTFPVNMLNWHVYRIEWTPGLLAAFIDGTEVGRITEDVPTAAMVPAIQTALQGADGQGHAREGTTPGGVDVKAWRVWKWSAP